MNLEEYLEAIRSCQDDLVNHPSRHGDEQISILTAEFGIYDNYFIILQIGMDKLRNDLLNLRFPPGKLKEDKDSPSYLFNKKILIQIHRPFTQPTSAYEYWGYKHDAEELAKRQEKYSQAIHIHTARSSKSWGENRAICMREIASGVVTIGDYVLKEKIPACFVDSIGWKYKDPFDCSRVVFHNP